jgi:predicted SAM-dependent methyltransferase
MKSLGLVRASIKRVLFGWLPTSVMNVILVPWRRLYWWQKSRINYVKNEKFAIALVRSGKPIKLELGSGKRSGMEEWIASDIGGGGDIQLDFTKPIPFPDESVEEIYSSHVLEHFSYPTPMLNLLRECRRILISEGAFRLAVPNARIFLEGYLNPERFEKERYCTYDVGLHYDGKIDFVNFIAYMGGDHKHMFDEENLVHVLEESGFKNVSLRQYDPSIDLEVRRHESIYAIGYK